MRPITSNDGVPRTTQPARKAGFGATQGTSTITFNGSAAAVLSWSDTSIRAVVPAAATSGNVVVRVNAAAFGTIQTEMIDRMVGEAKTGNPQRDGLASLHPVGRIGTAEEAAQAVIALLENPFITGSILTVDGGWTAQ